MSSVKHHDKVTFLELPFLHLLVKSLLLLSMCNFNGLVGFQLQFVQLVKLQQSMALGLIQRKPHHCGSA
jgi:hypothetical protein